MENKNSEIKSIELDKWTDYTGIVFKKKITISGANTNIVSIQSCVFEEELNIRGSNIGLLTIVNCKFKNKLYITSADDNKIEELFLGEVICDKELNLHVQGGTFVALMDCELFNQCILSSNNSNIVLGASGCVFHKTLSIRNLTADSFSFENNRLISNLTIDNFFIKNTDIYSLRLLKSSLLSNNNSVEALYYHRMEMELLLKESSDKWEKILLFLNRVSNNHGLNWRRGILFTMAITICFYFFYVLSLNDRMFYLDWGNFKGFFQALNYHLKSISQFFLLSHKLDFMNNQSPNGLSYIIDIIGRIFIGYGIYQTIQAFRKYGKNF